MAAHMAKMLINIPDELKEWAERLSGTQRLTVTDYIAQLIQSDVDSLTGEERELLLALGSRKRPKVPEQKKAGGRK